MCGIIVTIGKNASIQVENALMKIRHRGLDATNVLHFDEIAFGFNRLAINDKTDKGMQPFECGNLIGLFNGEVYNADRLREQFSLKTQSSADTEIILPLFEKEGSNIIHHLDGFYSGIIFNKSTKQIFFIRDYIGKKPLFLIKNSLTKMIVSELKTMDFIEDFQIIPKGFSELKGEEIHLIEAHKIPPLKKDKLKHAIFEGVKKRIPYQEKHFGVFLSGGLDSSIITSIVAQYAENVTYYTLGNAEDLHFVDILSQSLGIKHKIKQVALPTLSELPELIAKVVYHTESYNPSIVSNGLATYLLASEARKDGLNVVLSGEGADELFCGYTVSQNVSEWFNKRVELIENMHFTELRRLDLASMANTIEVRCPFLDREIYAISNDCTSKDLIANGQGKQILRDVFKHDLPSEIILRNKISFDVGSGIRKLVIEFITQKNKTEKEYLKEIWCQFFYPPLSENIYFQSYPTFDKMIEKRGIYHK